ncbi:hypothetical protein ACE3MQ_12265 [Paenibacillus lentus]|uniref:hypothetical protein n=1 Tax=Paenibacillus lentus TaxID=1338368 RepID=UPI00365F9605
MKVAIDQQTKQILDSTISKLDEWWKKSIAYISENQRYIYNVEIDGIILYDGYEDYITENINKINEIKVNTLSIEESILNTEKTIDEYLDRFIPTANRITEQLYGKIDLRQRDLFSKLVQGLDWIIQAMEFNRTLNARINTTSSSYSLGVKIFDSLTSCVGEIYKSIIQEDFVSVGDVLKYEVIPLLEKYRDRNKKSDLI